MQKRESVSEAEFHIRETTCCKRMQSSYASLSNSGVFVSFFPPFENRVGLLTKVYWT